jgi:DNA polymerase-1
VVRLLGWKVLNVPGVEADDVIGTLACMATEQGIDRHLQRRQGPVAAGERARHGDRHHERPPPRREGRGGRVRRAAALMVDYQTLVGDSVDNVPGVDKVGPKTAVKLLLEYGSLDNLVARADEVKGAVGENLRKALDWLPKGRALVTIRTDCDLKDHIPACRRWRTSSSAPQDVEKLKAFYDRYGFKGLVKQLERTTCRPS